MGGAKGPCPSSPRGDKQHREGASSRPLLSRAAYGHWRQQPFRQALRSDVLNAPRLELVADKAFLNYIMLQTFHFSKSTQKPASSGGLLVRKGSSVDPSSRSEPTETTSGCTQSGLVCIQGSCPARSGRPFQPVLFPRGRHRPGRGLNSLLSTGNGPTCSEPRWAHKHELLVKKYSMLTSIRLNGRMR